MERPGLPGPPQAFATEVRVWMVGRQKSGGNAWSAAGLPELGSLTRLCIPPRSVGHKESKRGKVCPGCSHVCGNATRRCPMCHHVFGLPPCCLPILAYPAVLVLRIQDRAAARVDPDPSLTIVTSTAAAPAAAPPRNSTPPVIVSNKRPPGRPPNASSNTVPSNSESHT